METFQRKVEFAGIHVTPNPSEQRYFSARSVLDQFRTNSCLMQNIKHGRVMGEFGRPSGLGELYGVGLLRRLLEFEVNNICFKIVDLGCEDYTANGVRVIYPQATIELCGPKAGDLLECLSNVRFVPRSLIDHSEAVHELSRIITWDAVIPK